MRGSCRIYTQLTVGAVAAVDVGRMAAENSESNMAAEEPGFLSCLAVHGQELFTPV